MARDVLTEALSSPNSVGIAALVSIRPRTQGELAQLTGVSVPAVLKHLRRLQSLGIVQENRVDRVGGRLLGVRRVYSSKGLLVGDFSLSDLKVVKLMKRPNWFRPPSAALPAMENLAEDLLLQRRRIREQVRRLGRMIGTLLEDQARLSQMAESAGNGIGERLVLETFFTEEDAEEAERVLIRRYGLKGGRMSIDRVMAEAKRFAKK